MRLGLLAAPVILLAMAASGLGEGFVVPVYERQVRPIFKAYCFTCHGEIDKPKGGLDLRLRRLIARGGRSGPALVPGKPEESLLYERLARHEMPPGKKKLSDEETALVGRWIRAGAPTARPEPEAVRPGLFFTEEERTHWAFQPIRRPAVHGASGGGNPVDAFLLARLREKGAAFAPEADRATLIRRASFDLLGLPPDPEALDRFVADPAPDAYERLVDRLLASPEYGERWGRHWLDVAGFADSDGYTSEDPLRPDAYKYRDYVIRAFNADMPFNQFIREQLAGDELVRLPYRDLPPGDIDKLVATGFLRTAPDGTGVGGVDQATAANQVLADTLKVVSTAFLGLTVGCAQCHDHKFDPISQVDYYRLRSVFEPAYDPSSWRQPAERRISLATEADRRKVQAIEAEAAKISTERSKRAAELVERTFAAELKKLPEMLRTEARAARSTGADKRTTRQKQLFREYPSLDVSEGSLYLYDPNAAAELKTYDDRVAKLQAGKPVEDFIRALTEVPAQVPVTYLFHRGDISQPRQAVTPGGLSILEERTPFRCDKDPSLPTTGRRLALACWLTDRRHPLTARVFMNRVWLHHFGRGLVGTPADFGVQGERPSHPELLDWLADEFMASGWRLKRMHRLLMTSAAYRQASRREPAKERLDPDNRLCGRMAVRRLEAEAIRDAILTVSGKLNAKAFGPPVPVREDEVGQFVVGVDNKDGDGRPGPEVPLHGEEFRRSIYVQVRRSRPLAVLDTFDAPAMEPNCELRNTSTVAPQALLLLNNAFIVSQAGYFAERVRREAGAEPRAQVRRAWRLAFGREPAEREIADALAFLAKQAALLRSRPGPSADAEPQALVTFCQTLFCANAFLYVD
jgi:hypothetical protein